MSRPARRDDRTASVIVLAPVVAELERRGQDADPILKAIGLARQDLLDAERRVPEAARLQLWRKATRASGDPYFGLHIAQHTKLGAYDVVDYAVHWSRTLGDALVRLVRFHRLLSDGTALSVEANQSCTSFRRISPPHVLDAHEADHFFATIVLRARELLGRPLNPLRVSFSHQPPQDSSPYRDVFGVQPMFADSRTELVLANRDLQARARRSDVGLTRILDRHAADLLARLPPLGDLVGQLRSHVMRHLSNGRASLAAMARLQGMSPRTIQRELLSRGTTFSDLVAEVRRESAIELLRSTSASVTEVAFLVGFTSTAAFHRVFKRWTGVTPEQLRRRERGSHQHRPMGSLAELFP